MSSISTSHYCIIFLSLLELIDGTTIFRLNFVLYKIVLVGSDLEPKDSLYFCFILVVHITQISQNLY